MRIKEETARDGYLQWFEERGVNIRIQTNKSWEELDVRMKNFYTERAEEYFRVRLHTDLGRIANNGEKE
jgi:uncharacterized protein YdaU (DUF1376 family)